MTKFADPRDLTSKPLAAAGLLSYRCKCPFGWIMIGAVDDEDAMVQARRSNKQSRREDLQKWDGNGYVPCPMPAPASESGSDADEVYLGHEIHVFPNRDPHRGGFEWSVCKDDAEINAGLDASHEDALNSARGAIDAVVQVDGDQGDRSASSQSSASPAPRG